MGAAPNKNIYFVFDEEKYMKVIKNSIKMKRIYESDGLKKYSC